MGGVKILGTLGQIMGYWDSLAYSCIRINLRDKIAMQFIFYKTFGFDSRLETLSGYAIFENTVRT